MLLPITQEFPAVFKLSVSRVVNDESVQIVMLAVCKSDARYLMCATLPVVDYRLSFAHLCQ
jgi:hypothetical protein